MSCKASESLEDFKEFCQVDLQLAENTIRLHARNIKTFLRFLNKNPQKASKTDLREYLKIIQSGYSPSTYKNVLASIIRYFRDYLEMRGIVSGFKFPAHSYTPKTLPSKAELKKFYEHLKNDRDRAIFLVLSSSGLRHKECLSLNRYTDVDYVSRMLTPRKPGNHSKHCWLSFYNSESEKVLKVYLNQRTDKDPRLFPLACVNKQFRKASERAQVHITPQILRAWFCSEMGELGVQDRYVDAFCGRAPKSILAKHYSDYSPAKLKRIYEKADLKVLK